jgi:hypothetical protein
LPKNKGQKDDGRRSLIIIKTTLAPLPDSKEGSVAFTPRSDTIEQAEEEQQQEEK